jgi:cytochrome c553
MVLGFRKTLFVCAAVCSFSLTLTAQEDGSGYFEKNVRPLFVEKCMACHGSGSAPAMSGLSLDSRESLLKGGTRGPALVSGKPEESLLLRVVRHSEGAVKMPPGKKLSDAEIVALARWIEMGAPWGKQAAPVSAAKYWSFVPPQAPSVPTVRNAAMVRTPIDAFVLAELEKKGLKQAPLADKRTLIRRATYDLTGLPPTPAEVQAFLNDNSPEAFAKVVDRLLASPRYGERWGRHWLDVARYADSNGLDENLVYKNAFRYRDYVIQAFNKDKPYDQFIREQLAGDLLPSSDNATTFERWTATGFLSLGAKMLAEDDPVKMEMDIIDEQLDTTARTFMGLTIGCARCHDHKFDPIPQADYYAMAGIFKSTKTMENFRVVAKWHEHVLAPKEDRDRLAAHEARIEEKRKQAAKITKAENDKLVAAVRRRIGAYLLASHEVAESQRTPLKPVAQPGAGAIVREAGSFDEGNVPRQLEKKKANTVKDAKAPHYAEYRINVASAGDYQIDISEEEKGRGTADLLINGELVKRGEPPVENREASPDEGGWSALGVFALKAGQNVIRLEHRARFPYFEKLRIVPSPFPAGAAVPRTTVQIARKHDINASVLEQVVEHLDRSQGASASELHAFETFGQANAAPWTSPVAKLFTAATLKSRESIAARYQELFTQALAEWEALPAETREKPEAALQDPGLEALRKLLFEKFGPFRAPGDASQYYPAEAIAALRQIEKEQRDLEAATPDYPRAMGVCENDKITDLPIHLRGSHWNLGQTVERGFIRSVSTREVPKLGKQSSGRLELAEWLTAKDHPLTSRVMVNRMWRWHFGKGIVASVDNFGRLGEKPSNQPLLDWLAIRFIESGWSMKAMHRLMMLSTTYQLSSAWDAKNAEADPENTALWRMSRRRLEAEEIRDAIMSVSGHLDTAGGGSIMNYKDRQYVANTSRRGDIDYDRNLRAIYIPVVRSSMYEVFSAFDLPDPSTPNGDRDSTVVAPQALFMLNGSVVLKHSKLLAETLLNQYGPDDAARLREVYERAFSRPPTARETDQALTFLAQIERTLTGPESDRRVLAWQSLCKALIASNEFIYLN